MTARICRRSYAVFIGGRSPKLIEIFLPRADATFNHGLLNPAGDYFFDGASFDFFARSVPSMAIEPGSLFCHGDGKS